MKILQTVFSINDYGGIVNHVENLALGLRELGHECDMVLMKDDDRPRRLKKEDTHIPGTYDSVVARKVHTTSGWYGAAVIGYCSKERIEDWARLTDGYDLVIHQLPVPKPDADGWWREIYRHCQARQIAIAHDAHFRDAYPHMIEIAEYLVGVSVTNPAGYEALSELPAPRVFVGAPHVPRNWRSQEAWHDRPTRFVSAHVWKAWKRMDRVLRALPHLPKSVGNVIGGDGIEARYMRSRDKCKPRYEGLWRQAQRARMNYVGMIPSAALMSYYENSRVMVDLSYSDKFAALGNHFNRSTIEAYNGGCVPLCVTENMTDHTGLFDGEPYLTITEERSRDPKAMADAIWSAVNLNPKVAEWVVHHGRKLLTKHFDYRVSAQGFLDLARGKRRIGIYGKTEVGVASLKIRDAARDIIRRAENEQ